MLVVCFGIEHRCMVGIIKTCCIFDRCVEERHAHKMLCFAGPHLQ
jgi:hypothetical protein